MGKQAEPWNKWFHRWTGILESASGSGSSLSNTKEVRSELPILLRQYGFKSMADVPCGDWNWMRQVDLGNVEYTGYDVVPDLIDSLAVKYPHSKFRVLNAVEGCVAPCDVILCRDFLFHLSYANIWKVLKNFKRSADWLLTTIFTADRENADVQDNAQHPPWRPLNLMKMPFCLKPPVSYIQENDGKDCRGRIVGLFNLKEEDRV